MQKTILVTGGAGYIGSACVQSLVDRGWRAVVFDDLSTGQADKVSPKAELIKGSILNKKDLQQVCQDFKFDAVMHFAAKKAVGESEEDPSLYFENNVTGSFNILKAMETFGIPQIIFSSTAAVYAPPRESAPIFEDAPIGPVSVYGLTKLMVEDMIQAYARTGKISRYSILRYFNVAGDFGLNYKEDKAQNVFPTIAKTITNDGEFMIFGDDYDTTDGTCVRDYIHLRDLVEAHALALGSSVSGIYNLGTGNGYSVKQLVEAFNAELKKPLKVKKVDRRLGDAPLVVADATLAKKEFNWQPKHTLKEMVEDTLRVYEN